MTRWTLPKLYMLVALRYHEGKRGAGTPATLDSSQAPVARSLARSSHLTLSRQQHCGEGTLSAALTKRGRASVDAVLRLLNTTPHLAQNPETRP